jgi:hypothetical protein
VSRSRLPHIRTALFWGTSPLAIAFHPQLSRHTSDCWAELELEKRATVAHVMRKTSCDDVSAQAAGCAIMERGGVFMHACMRVCRHLVLLGASNSDEESTARLESHRRCALGAGECGRLCSDTNAAALHDEGRPLDDAHMLDGHCVRSGPPHFRRASNPGCVAIVGDWLLLEIASWIPRELHTWSTMTSLCWPGVQSHVLHTSIDSAKFGCVVANDIPLRIGARSCNWNL